MADSSKIALIDICGTLFRSNTTFDFFKWYLKDDKLYQFFCKIKSLKLISFFNYNFFLLTGFDVVRSIAVRFLKGINKNDLILAADSFYMNYLNKCRNDLIIELVDSLKKKGYRIILCSATLDFIAQSVANHLKVKEILPSELKYENEVCAGCILNDLLGRKKKAVLHYIKKDNIELVVTDDCSDLNIINLSKKSYLVQYKDRKNKWLNLKKEILAEWEIIEI